MLTISAHCLRHCLLASAAILAIAFPHQDKQRQARVWTSSDGQYSVSATLVEFSDGVAHLKRDDGQTIEVPAIKLSQADHIYIVETTGWGRVWKDNSGDVFLIADLTTVDGEFAVLQTITGGELRFPISTLSKPDREYVEARRPAPIPTPTDTFTAKVIGVKDGDTISILLDEKPVTVRLNGIDAPEVGQAFSAKAKKHLSSLVFGKEVTIYGKGTDKYGRWLADVVVDETNASKSLVSEGLAWHYKQYSDDQALAEGEQAARDAKIGLWSERGPVAPWEFRKWGPAERKAYAQKLVEEERRARAPPKTASQSKPKEETKAPPALTHWITNSSGVRHNRSCRWYHNSKGRPCGPNEGRACKVCGG